MNFFRVALKYATKINFNNDMDMLRNITLILLDEHGVVRRVLLLSTKGRRFETHSKETIPNLTTSLYCYLFKGVFTHNFNFRPHFIELHVEALIVASS